MGYAANPLKEATLTRVQNRVEIRKAMDAPGRAAHVGTQLSAPDMLVTGLKSKAELTAADNTVIRVGSNTSLSFGQDKREINLTEGAIIFNSPKGKGGGVIRTAAISASVTGTTLAIAATANGGFKMVVVEGRARIRMTNGRTFSMLPGQLTLLQPGQTAPPPVVSIDLGEFVESSGLIQDFDQPLPSQENIQKAVNKQAKDIKERTGLFVSDSDVFELVETQNVIDSSLLQTALVELQAAALSDAQKFVNFVLTDITVGTDFASLFDERIFTQDSIKSRGLTQSSLNLLADEIGVSSIADNFQDLSLSGFSSSDLNLTYSTGGSFVIPSSTTFLVARNMTFSGGTYDLQKFQSEGIFAFAAGNDITFNGSATFMHSPETLGIGSVGTVTVASGSTLSSDASMNFGIGSNKAMSLSGITVENTVGSVYVGSLSDLTLKDMTFRSGYGKEIHHFSDRTLDVNNVSYYSGVDTIRMQAETINLRNIDFPSGSEVILKSRLGVANFGSSQSGKVNFISNVRYGGGSDITNQSILDSNPNISVKSTGN